jgi:peptidyl-dipeptidase Dcp
MKSRQPICLSLLALSLNLAACSRPGVADQAPPPTVSPQTPATVETPVTPTNPLFVKSELQYEAPNYALITKEHFMPAFERGMQEQLAQVQAIVDSTAAPTFENTIVAMEKSGQLLDRSTDAFFSLSGTVSDDEIQAIEAQFAPKGAAHADALHLNAKLFARIEAVYNQRESLEGEAKRLTEKYYTRWVRAGAKLDAAAQAKIRELNAELSTLSTKFSQNLLQVSKEQAVIVDSREELAGLSDGEIAGLAAAAQEAGMPGKFRIALQNTSRHSLLSKLENRELRERLWTASTQRALAENGPVLQRMVALRTTKAQILGYRTWANYVLDDQMAKTPEAVLSMLDDMAPQIVAKTKAEASEIKALMKANKVKHDLKPWDWFYYAEKVRAKKYNVDEKEVHAYFELDRVLHDGVFFAMNRLFGISFKERNDLPVYHPDVRTFEVFDEKGQSIGLFYADYFARTGKQGGAWMNALVGQNHLLGRKPVIINCLNIAKPAAGEPALLDFSEVTTLFHEMGHAVHGLFSNVTYPTLAGTSVPRDYVEFPSQFEEDWAIHPLVLANYAKHYQTGAPIPEDLLKRLLASKEFNKGFDSLEYVKAALLDMEWHGSAEAITRDPEAFEKAAFAKHQVEFDIVAPRYKSAYFSHVFGGGYSAGYYAYIWTEVLAADAFAHMANNGGLTRANGDRIRDTILSRGNTIDPMEQYVNYRGQSPSVDALLIRRGLVKKK